MSKPRPQTGSLLERLAPHGPLPARLLYLAVRATHFLLMVIAIPLAYKAARAAGQGGPLPDGLLVIVWYGSLLWLMFHFMLHSFVYPVTLGEAVAATTVPLVNLCAAGMRSFELGALSVILASVVALALAILIMLVIVTVPALRARLTPQAPGYMGKLLAVLLPLQLLLVAAFAAPLTRPAAGRPSLLIGFGFMAQLVSELRLLHRGSIFDREGSRLDSPRARASAAWTPFMILCMFAALAGFAWVAFIRG